VRVLRVAIGRRALQVGLLLGGLLVLGFLWGEQAQAADGIGALPGSAVAGLVKPAAEGADDVATALGPGAAADPGVGTVAGNRVGPAKGSALEPVAPDSITAEPGHHRAGASGPRNPAPDTVPGALTDVLAHPADGKVLRPVTEDLVGVVGDQVVRPVGELVETVTTGLTETVGMSPPASLPELPPLPSFPESPSWPTLPGVPVRTLPVPAPVTSAPRLQPGGHAATTSADEKGPVGADAVYGPRFSGWDTLTETVAHTSAHRTTTSSTAAPAPGHRVPSDTPGGALGGKPAVDNGSSRHGDAYAVTLIHRAFPRLVPGAAADVDAAGTRDRHRDIPVFPG
jgi:hypothetical protein